MTPPLGAGDDRSLFGMGLRLLAILLLATMMLFVKLAGESGIALPEIMFWRSLLAVPPIMIWVWATAGLATLKTDYPRKPFARSLFGITGMVCNLGAVTLLPLAEATTFGFATPIFATLLAVLILKEKVGWHRWTAVLLGFVGVLVVANPGGAPIPMKGAAIALTGAFLVAIISLQIRDMTRTEPPARIAFWFSLICALIMAPLMPFFMTGHDAYQWMLLVLIGLFGGTGQMLLTASLRYAPVSAVVPMDYSSLIWATLFGWFVWDHLPPASTWLGAPIIVASGLYIVFREHKLAVARQHEPVA